MPGRVVDLVVAVTALSRRDCEFGREWGGEGGGGRADDSGGEGDFPCMEHQAF